MKILIEESVLRQALEFAEMASEEYRRMGPRIADALRTALDDVEKVEDQLAADQLRQAKAEVLREAASRWAFTGKTSTGYTQVVREDELLRMADEISNIAK